MKKKKEIIKGAALPATLDILGLLSYAGLPSIPTAALQHFCQESAQRRVEAAREIILSEISEGNFANADKDELLSVIIRYRRCAIEGAAKRNLRIMAKKIKGMDDKNELNSQSFIKYSDILATLTEEDVRHLMDLYDVGVIRYERIVGLNPSELDESEGVYQSLLKTGFVHFVQEMNSFIKQPNMLSGPDDADFEGPNAIRTRVVSVYRIAPKMEEIVEYMKSLSDEELAE